MIWKAVFIIRNYIFEKPMSINYKPPFTSEIKYECLPNNKGTTVSITFDVEHVSKPPVLQQRQAIMLLSMLKEISTPFVMEDFDTELIELVPLSEEDKKKYNNIESPPDWSFTPKPKIVRSDIIKKIEESFLKIYSSKFVFSGKDVSEYHSLIILRTMLKWYNRSLEYKGLLDRFISLWVTFNVIYDYLWKYNHPNKKLPKHSIRISDCICNTLNGDECEQIFEPYKFVLPMKMPPYELIGATQKELNELLKSKDIKKIEANHRKFLDKEKQDLGFNTKDCLVNRHGLDFGKYWYVEDWVNSLAQVLLNIYGVRNLVFHSGEIPMEAVEGIIDDPDSFQYWNMLNDILSKVDAVLIAKILNHFSTIS
jgi:hypothetical protein